MSAAPRFERPGGNLDLPAEERDVLRRWREGDVPRQVLEHRKGRREYVFYEGPPTANGRPGIHHVLARTLKDVVCRYHSMNGCHVPRKAGWDTHGLPVEIEVQKELGIANKREIEAYGIGPFNARCRESVFRYQKEWQELSERMAFWLDYEHPYITCSNEYISSVWSILARFFEAGLLEKGSRVLPYCPTCGTGLSSHEVAQGYQDVRDPSVFVRFPRRGHPGEAFLVWTTTPWTLPANVALAVHPDLEYVRVRRQEPAETLILARPLLEAVFRKEVVEVLEALPGRRLEGERYERPFEFVPLDPARSERVVLAEFVSAEDGTGIVHIAPAFGVDDHEVGLREGLELPNPVDDEGRFDARIGPFAGRSARGSNDDLARDLKERGRLFRKDVVQHSYPHCWRCKTPLLYWLRPCWYIRTTRLRDELVAQNRRIEWFPPEIGTGRFGEWLAGNVDWALSRERYWGTPLNLWICTRCQHVQAVTGEEDLRRRVPDLAPGFDLHRPGIDEIALPCSAPGCRGEARRTPEVIDCWFDSGAMPFAQHGWHAPAPPPAEFPADFISEGLDQTRGWFYTLHVISTFLAGGPAYRRCLVANLLLDAKRQKMSKSRGNTVDPWEEIEQHGIDAIRWYLLAQSNPWLPKLYDGDAVAAAGRDFFGTLWSCYSFLATYADIDGFDPDRDAAPPVPERPEMDRWVLAELSRVVGEMRRCMDGYDLTGAVHALAEFVDRKLSNWYVRRSRSRFWAKEVDADKRAAFFTLFQVLETAAELVAPFAPLFADALHRRLRPEAVSVHLRDYPRPEEGHRDAGLEEAMDAVLAVVGLGRRARLSAGIHNRQPLARAFVKAPRPELDEILRGRFGDLAREELNVRELVVATEEVEQLRSLRAKPNFKRLGPRVGARMGAVKAAVEALGDAELELFQREGRLELPVAGDVLALEAEDLEILLLGKEGYGVESDGYYLVALDTQLTPDLIEEGLVREVVKRVNNSRRDGGLRVEDRIHLWLSGSRELLEAAGRHRDRIARDTLAEELVLDEAPATAGVQRFDWEVGELSLSVQLRRR